jgi:hypothetical protein
MERAAIEYAQNAQLRQMLGSLAFTNQMGGLVVGERKPIAATSGVVAVPASGSAGINAVFDIGGTPSQPDRAFLIETMGGLFQASDASGKLQLIASAAGIASHAGGPPTFLFPVFGQVGSFPANATQFFGFFVQPPGAFRDRDIRGVFAPTVQLSLVVIGLFLNTDAGAAHSASVTLSGWLREIDGVSP